MRASTTRLLFLGLALLLALLVAGLGSASFQRKVESFQPLGFTAEAAQGVWRVSEVADPRIGLSVGDEILMAHGQAVGSRDRLAEVLRGEGTTRLAVMRGGELIELEYRRPPLAIEVTYLILALVGAAYLLIGLYTALKDQRPQARLFYLWCVTSGALYLLSPAMPPVGLAERAIFLADQLARDLLPALTLHLFLVFPTPLFAGRWRRFVLPLVYLPTAALLLFHAEQLFLGGRLAFGPATAARLAAVDRLELALLVGWALLAVATLVARLVRRREWETRRQVQWIALGMLGGYLPFLALYVAPLLLGLRWPPWMAVPAVAPLALVPLAFAWAILKYKLWDLGVIVRDSIAYSLTALVGVAGFSLINLAIQRGFAPDLGLIRNILTFGAGLTIAGVLVPTKNAISAGLERLQYRGSLGSRRALARAGLDLLQERDLDALCETLLARLSEGLSLARTQLYLAQGGAMVPVALAQGLPAELPFDAFDEGFWGRDVESLHGVEMPGEPTPSYRLFTAGYRYAFPLRVRDRRVGVALVGYKFDEEPLNSEDLELARGLLNQAALAIENAQLLEEVHRKLGEVVRLREHSRGIIESSPAGIVVLAADDTVVSANHAFAAVVGVERPQLQGRRVDAFLPVRPLPPPGSGELEVSYCEASGRERYLRIEVAAYPQDEGPDQRVLVVQDVSERMRMALALEEKERMASLGMLAAGVAHEVNTPITGISSYAQMLLLDTDASDPRYDLLKKMERQSFRAAQIVNNLLEFSRNRDDVRERVSLPAVVDECVRMLSDRAAEAGVELTAVCEGDAAQAVVSGREPELHQVATNLVVNALDAIGHRGRGGRVTVTVTPEERTVVLRVIDDGPGVPPERLERIFDPFFSSKLGRGGTGLGLAITANIVRRHGGTIHAENHPGAAGCTFAVALPRPDER